MRQDLEDNSGDFIGIFALLAGGIWIVGAAILVAMAMLGQSRV